MAGPIRFSREYLERFAHAETASEPAACYAPHPSRFTEHLIQLIWRNSLYDATALTTAGGLAVTIHSPGRYNTGAGPDFKNADITVGGERLAGDIEIHKHAREWYEHKHHRSPLYDLTVLHVVMERGGNTPAAVTRRGRTVHELEIGLHLRHPLEELHEELEKVHTPLTGRPFDPPCAAQLRRLGPKTVPSLFNFIGDGRALLKSNRVIARLARRDPEQAFYELLFESLGHASFNRQFAAMARALPREQLRAVSAANPSAPMLALQAALYRVAGFAFPGPEAGAEAMSYIAAMERAALPALAPILTPHDWPLAGCRPANYPQRRIAAMAAMLATGISGAAMRERFAAMPLDPSPAEARAFARDMLAGFTAVSDPFWDRRYSFNRPARNPKKLVGRDKAISLVVDAAIPFLLALARVENDLELEQRLVFLYHTLPVPSSNALVDFMRRTVLGRDAAFFPKTVCHQQALLQVYKDFCHAAPAACRACPFVEYLKCLPAAPEIVC